MRADIDEAAIEAFMTGLAEAGATPRAMADYALALAALVRDTPGGPASPINRATLAETLRRLRLRLIEEP